MYNIIKILYIIMIFPLLANEMAGVNKWYFLSCFVIISLFSSPM